MKSYLLLPVLCFSVLANAQTETSIVKHYQDINKQVQESKQHGMEGTLYCNEWVTNKNSMSWPAVGIYSETIQFWYNDDPNHISPGERDPKTVLEKVTVTRKAAADFISNEEYLYMSGKPVFFYSIVTEEGKQWETRLYFNTKGMFKSSVKIDGKELTAKELALPENSDLRPKPLVERKNARKYQDLFVMQMVY